MPWCPNCKTEYQEGIEVCSDCGATLVDELPDEKEKAVVAFISEESLADKLVDYLNYSNIEAERAYDEAESSFAVTVDADCLDEAQTAFRAFYNVESKNMLLEEREKLANALEKVDFDGTEIDEELLEEIPEEEMSAEEKETIAKALMAEKVYKPAEVYVKKADVSKEMFSTAITFLVFAALLLVFLVLNALDIIKMFNNVPSLALIGAMSIGCCLVGINAIKRSRNAEIASVEEEKLTASLENWLEENITDELFDELAGEDLSEEILYLRRTEIIKKKLEADYPELDENYADELIEEFYNNHFANEDETDEDTETDASEESEKENE